MHFSNIIFNYIFIYGWGPIPAMGVQGAGLGTALATAIGPIRYFYLGIKHSGKEGFLKSRPTLKELKKVIELMVPASLQNFFFSMGLLTMLFIVGKVGTLSLAAVNVILNIVLVALLLGIGLGLGASTLVGQAMGEKKIEDAYRWGIEVSKLGLLIGVILGLPMILIPEYILSVFLNDPLTIEIAKKPLMLTGFGISFDMAGMVLMNALLGAGDNKSVMKISLVTQWIFYLPLAYLIGPILGKGLIGIWMANFIYRSLQAGLFFRRFTKREWQKIKI